MRNTVMFILAIHILIYVSVLLDVPILRQCIGFVYLTFVPGFVIFRAMSTKNQSIPVEIFVSVSLSIVFLMFTGLFANTLFPLIGVSAPLSALPLLIIVSVLTLAVFAFSQMRSMKRSSMSCFQLPNFETNIEGFLLCFFSVLVLSLSIIGSLYDSVPLMLFVVAGSAAIFVTGFLLRNQISSDYFALALFLISFSLLLQTSLISRHLMGWDIFAEYFATESVGRIGMWIPSGSTSSYTQRAILNSILSVTILPTVYSTVLNLNGELVLKIIFPFILCLVPIGLYKIYESQLGKVVAYVSVFFFIADPLNLYGLGSISLAREMITYLFLSAVIFCYAYRDLDKVFDTKMRRILILAFSAGLAVSHYSLAFLYLFFLVFIYLALRIRGKRNVLLDLPMLLCIFSIVFGWYMYVSSPPLNKLVDDLNIIVSNFSQDFFSSGRLDPGMSTLSPLSQTINPFNLVHKILIYVTEFFVAVGIVVLIVRPKEFKLNRVFSLMAIFAALLLFALFVVPNLSSTLNFSRFYRFTMIFLAPMFTLGGVFLLGSFKKMRSVFRFKHKLALKDLRLTALVSILFLFLLFRSGFVTTITNGLPSSYSLDFDRMKTSTTVLLYVVYFTESDLSGAGWLGSNINEPYLVYADYGLGAQTLTGYAHMNPETVRGISNTVQAMAGSYVYLRSLNTLEELVTDPGTGSTYFSFATISPSLSQNNQVYSNGVSYVYFIP